MRALINAAVRAIGRGNDTVETRLSPNAQQDGTEQARIKRLLLTQRDDYGNTPLHLAAWNGSKAIFRWLVQNGADLDAVNDDGLSPVSLTARFGLWDMLRFIRDEHLITPIWQYGYVKCTNVNFSHHDTTRNLQDKYSIEYARQKQRVLLQELDKRCKTFALGLGKPQPVTALPTRDVGLGEYFSIAGIEQACESLLKSESGGEPHQKHGAAKGKPINFFGVIEVIRIFRPSGWHEAIRDCVDDLVLKKWRKCYALVYIGQTCIPSLAAFLIFGLMWRWRRLTLVQNSGLPGWYAPPLTDGDPEAGCGWPAIRESRSGRIQAVLAVYGVLAMIGVAMGEQRLRPHDLAPAIGSDGEGDDNSRVLHIVYVNLKALLCLVSAAMFLGMGAARVMAGPECDEFYVDAEKNATVFAGLFLFSNLLNLLRPVEDFGTTFLSIYQMIVTDLFRFSVVYMSLFLAFLVAIQTIFSANNYFLNNMFDGALVNSTAYHSLAGAGSRRKANGAGAAAGAGSQITRGQSTSIDTSACTSRIMTASDTAFKLLTTSLGDGFGDLLEMARSEPDPACGGYRSDHILSILVFAWVVLTNILTMNVLIAMLTKTFDKNVERSGDNWTLDIMARVIQYERQFPELQQRAHRPSRTAFSIGGLLDDVGLILYSIPEVHVLWRISTCAWSFFATFNPVSAIS